MAGLAQMPPEIYQAFEDQLRAAKPSRSAAGLIQQLRPPSSDIAHLWATSVLMLVGLRLVNDQQGFTPEHVAAAITSEASRLKLVDSERGPILRDRLGRLLGLRPIVVTSKAFDLVTEHEHPLMDARILTDIRMIFDAPSERAPSSVAALIVHVLKLLDIHGKEYYMSLGRDDLRKLQAIVERALAKEHELRTRLSAADLQCLDEVDEVGANQ